MNLTRVVFSVFILSITTAAQADLYDIYDQAFPSTESQNPIRNETGKGLAETAAAAGPLAFFQRFINREIRKIAIEQLREGAPDLAKLLDEVDQLTQEKDAIPALIKKHAQQAKIEDSASFDHWFRGEKERLNARSKEITGLLRTAKEDARAAESALKTLRPSVIEILKEGGTVEAKTVLSRLKWRNGFAGLGLIITADDIIRAVNTALGRDSGAIPVLHLGVSAWDHYSNDEAETEPAFDSAPDSELEE